MCQLTIVGNAFLWHQIRCIMAVLFLVGRNQESPEVRVSTSCSCVCLPASLVFDLELGQYYLMLQQELTKLSV